MKFSAKYLLSFVCLLALGGCVFGNGSSQNGQIRWNNLRQGLASATVTVGDRDNRKDLILLKIDPHLFEFRVFQNYDESSPKTLQQIQNQESAVVTFNGAFFDEKFQPMGLLQDSISTYHSQISSGLMNGIFSVPNKSAALPKVFSLSDVPDDQDDFLLQNGPILINDQGKITVNTDTEKLAARTALAVDDDGNVVLIILHQTLLNSDNVLSLYRFAHLLREDILLKPLDLHSVLNLDGGPSTGVVVGDQYVPELNPIQNAVFVLPRAAKI